MFPGQFGNANQCLRIQTVDAGISVQELLVTDTNRKYLLFKAPQAAGTYYIYWDKGIGNIEFLLTGGGGGGGTSVIKGYAGRGGNGGATITGTTVHSYGSEGGTLKNRNTITIGSGGQNQSPYGTTGGNSFWGGGAGYQANGGTAGFTGYSETDGLGGYGAGGATPTNGRGTDGYGSNIENTLSTNNTYYAAGGGGGSVVRRTAGTYVNSGGLTYGGFGMQYPLSGSLYTAASGSYGSGGGGGGYFSDADGAAFRYGNTGGSGTFIGRTSY